MKSSHQKKKKSETTFLLENLTFKFPFEPYTVQKNYMTSIIQSLKSCGHFLGESPTGTGKTISLLTSTLFFQRHYQVGVIFEWIRRVFPKYQIKSNYMKPPRGFDSLPIKGIRRSKKFTCKDPFDVIDLGDLSSPFDEEVYGKIENAIKEGNEGNALRLAKLLFNSQMGNKWFPTVIYATRTHSQINQIKTELERVGEFISGIKMTILGSKGRYCINKIAKNSRIFTIDEECKRMRDERKCHFYNKTITGDKYKKAYDNCLPHVFDIEDLKASCEEMRKCPYYFSQELLEDAEFVICPYQYLLDPMIKDALKMDQFIKSSIVIFDEGHNIEDTCRDAVSFEWSIGELDIGIKELKKQIKNLVEVDTHSNLENYLQKFKDYIESINLFQKQGRNPSFVLNFSDVDKLFDKIDISDVAIKERNSDLTIALKTANTMANKNQTVIEKKKKKKDTLSTKTQVLLEKVVAVVEIMLKDEKKYKNDYYVVIEERAIKKNIKDKYCSFLAMNPAIAMESIAKKASSIIVTSGTLTPLNSFSSELGIDFYRIYCGGHVVNVRNQVFISGVSALRENNIRFNGTFQNLTRNGNRYYTALGVSILKLCKTIPYGILVFLPSYTFLNKMKDIIKQIKLPNSHFTIHEEIEIVKKIFWETRGSSKKMKKKFKSSIKNYKSTIKDCENNRIKNGYQDYVDGITGGIFFGVTRGKLSEGIDFSHNQSRGVIVISIPYPSVFDENVRLKKVWNDRNSMNSQKGYMKGNDWYSLQAWRSVNQSLGRCIRNNKDYGAIILMDERYNGYGTIKKLPGWISGVVRRIDYIEDCSSEIKKFFNSPVIREIEWKYFEEKKQPSHNEILGSTKKRSPYIKTKKKEVKIPKNNLIDRYGFDKSSPLPHLPSQVEVNTSNFEKPKKEKPEKSKIIFKDTSSSVSQNMINTYRQSSPNKSNSSLTQSSTPEKKESPSQVVNFQDNTPPKINSSGMKKNRFSQFMFNSNSSQPQSQHTSSPQRKIQQIFSQNPSQSNYSTQGNIITQVNEPFNGYNGVNREFNSSQTLSQNNSIFHNNNNINNNSFQGENPINTQIRMSNAFNNPAFAQNNFNPTSNFNNFYNSNSAMTQVNTSSQFRNIPNTSEKRLYTQIEDDTPIIKTEKRREKNEFDGNDSIFNRKNLPTNTILGSEVEIGNLPSNNSSRESNDWGCQICGYSIVSNDDLKFLEYRLKEIRDRPYLQKMCSALNCSKKVRYILPNCHHMFEDNVISKVSKMNESEISQDEYYVLNEKIKIPKPKVPLAFDEIQVFAQEDRCVYKLLFCKNCKKGCVGVEIVMATDGKKVGEVVLFKHLVVKKRNGGRGDFFKFKKRRKKKFLEIK